MMQKYIMKLSGINSRPRILSSDSHGTIHIGYPNGSVYEYITYDAAAVNQIVQRYGRNMGQLVKALKIIAKKVNKLR